MEEQGLDMQITGVALRSPQGEIYQLEAPRRHSDVIAAMWGQGAGELVHSCQQGFVTASGEYLDRRQALQLALKTGQLETGAQTVPGLEELYSEDLW
jgi:hypothetical protein